MNIPRADERSKEAFRSFLPDDPRVTVRPMFDNVSAFMNGNMFFGVFGNDLFVRLSDNHRKELLKKGASLLEPVQSRPMKEYVMIPRAWWKDPETIRSWVGRSLEWASKLPAKTSRK
ncbi:hypothetical protein AUG19_00045 [archaeon 13_1_20CM_2_54_9]|nr:MAG: hypothetical protein AUJ07_02800 [Crenarchaeota archaeon 13_1_40CM_3_53_5]OLE77600.1 MAG: hypothetical protein AUG19_00045 [archaeon 13_1_20CM_2_54_9]TMI27713.1 MAG: TfoX/Sxy family protein [Candidatus Bathyarchaeota archaeon]TMI30090.1 MAG: TfoX/Sxy family protein [Candidatus Bathyarchaeota archaeon]